MEGVKQVREKTIESIEQMIREFAEETYKEVTDSYPDFGKDPSAIYYSGACRQFSEIMKRKLAAQGITMDYQQINIKGLLPTNTRPHVILSSPNLIVDGTWQQFIDKPRDINRCLILNKNSLIQDLEKAGVPRNMWFIYGAQSN